MDEHESRDGLAPTTSGNDSMKLSALLRDYGDRWEIEQGAAWVACTRSGSFTHVIAAHTLDDLRTKLEAAEHAAPPVAV
jgi:hypothetical protein